MVAEAQNLKLGTKSNHGGQTKHAEALGVPDGQGAVIDCEGQAHNIC